MNYAHIFILFLFFIFNNNVMPYIEIYNLQYMYVILCMINPCHTETIDLHFLVINIVSNDSQLLTNC